LAWGGAVHVEAGGVLYLALCRERRKETRT
jgi:hypothetical protein